MPYIVLDSRRKALLFSAGVLLASIPLFIVAFILAGELLANLRLVGGLVVVITSNRVNSLLVTSLILLVLPYSVVDSINRSYVSRLTGTLPFFFKALAEAVRSGLTFQEALRSVSETTPGPLGAEIRKAVVRVELGETLVQALGSIAERIREPVVEKAVTILVAASESGGRVIDVLESAADTFAALRNYEEERAATINPHVLTIYVSTFIYIVLALTILYVFVIPLASVQRAGGFFGVLDPRLYETLMFYAGAITAFFGGLIAGKMKHGRASAGLIHSAIQLVLVALSFTLAGAYLVPLSLAPG